MKRPAKSKPEQANPANSVNDVMQMAGHQSTEEDFVTQEYPSCNTPFIAIPEQQK
jgi:hypothetical protein